MSLAVLKRKAQTKYNNMSANSTSGFSLNGTHRNQGYVGQTSLSRTIIRTPHKGATPRGHGGQGGTYTTNNIKESTTCSTEDASVVKSSSINTHGLIDTKYKWTPQYNHVKPDSNQNNGYQSIYVTNVAQKEIDCCAQIDASSNEVYTSSRIDLANGSCVITQPEGDFVAIPQSQYLSTLKKSCIDNNNTSQASIGQTPLPGN
jgi:hypothetical protein|tara:strand:+ start:406 stop:1014 length:609 start_codon:yes stop_codon:yes gene_type:complete